MPTTPQDMEKPKIAKEIQELTRLVALVLYRQAVQSDKSTNKESEFESNFIPAISIEDYINRFVYYTEIDEAELIHLPIYIDRYINYTKQNFNLFNAHRLIAAALVLAQKTCSDFCLGMTFYAQVAGVSLKELNILERKLLCDLEHNLFVTTKEYLLYKEGLALKARKYAARGWGTFAIYTSKAEMAFFNAAPSRPPTPTQEQATVQEELKSDEPQAKKHFLPELKPNKEPQPSLESEQPKQPNTLKDRPATASRPSSGYDPRLTCKPFRIPPMNQAPSSKLPVIN